VAERGAPVRRGMLMSQPWGGCVCSELNDLSAVAGGEKASTGEVRTLLPWHFDGSGRGGKGSTGEDL
jgi:hypothetical protein